MKVQLNTDNHIQGDEPLARHVSQVVEDVLGRFSGQITRVEVHLSDLNAGKHGSGDKHCLMEARPEGHEPVTATHDAETVREAINGAAKKLHRVLGSTLGKRDG